MWIRRAVAWLFDVGDGTEAEASNSGVGREETCLMRVLKSISTDRPRRFASSIRRPVRKSCPPKPPRAKRERGLWVGRYVDSLSSSLSEPVGAEA